MPEGPAARALPDRRAALFALLGVALAGCGGGGSADGESAMAGTVQTRSLPARSNGTTYPLNIYLPPGIAAIRAGVPVIYLLDGDSRFAAVVDIIERTRAPVVVVGIGNEALRNRDRRPLHDVIREDAARVRAVREAVGPDVELFVDANCNLDLYHATALAEMIKPYGIGFFEEPLTQNDVQQMAELRRISGMPLACGQNEGLLYRFRDLLLNKSVDVLQPNVAISGGITQCLKVARLAAAFNVPIDNGGAWPFHNMHLHAGLAHGGMVEYHYLAVELCRQLYRDLPKPEAGWLTLPTAPGLGFEPDRDAIRELAKLPLSQGNSKG